MEETKRDFAEDQRICDAATEGTWECDDSCDVFTSYTNEQTAQQSIAAVYCTEDARFITEARTGWPAALAEIERLQAENERMRTVLGTLEAQAWNDVRMRTGGVSVGLPVFTSLHLARGFIRDIEWAREIPESNNVVTEVTADATESDD